MCDRSTAYFDSARRHASKQVVGYSSQRRDWLGPCADHTRRDACGSIAADTVRQHANNLSDSGGSHLLASAPLGEAKSQSFVLTRREK